MKKKVTPANVTPPTQAPEPPKRIILDPAKYGGLRDIRARMDALSPEIISLAVGINRAKKDLEGKTEEFASLDQRLVNSIKAAAKESGVNLDEGKWEFQLTDLSFTKTA